MGLAPACGRVHIVVERRSEDAAESFPSRTDSCMLNQQCMPISSVDMKSCARVVYAGFEFGPGIL